MEKCFSYEYKTYYSSLLPKAIRNKTDIIKTILFICQIIIAEKSNEQMDGIIISINKNSRVFIKTGGNYFYSVVFPFTLSLENNQPQIFYKTRKIDAMILSALNCLINEVGEQSNIFDKLFDSDLYREYGYDIFAFVVDIYFHLLSFDDGYIRYEKDEERENKEYHPLHHFDICYHNNSTYKLGLYNEISLNHFREIMDITKQCWYVRQNKS